MHNSINPNNQTDPGAVAYYVRQEDGLSYSYTEITGPTAQKVASQSSSQHDNWAARYSEENLTLTLQIFSSPSWHVI